MDATTKAPVTISGWYELTDGRVGHVTLDSLGHNHIGEIVASWEDVPKRDFAADDRAQQAAKLGGDVMTDNATKHHREYVLLVPPDRIEIGMTLPGQPRWVPVTSEEEAAAAREDLANGWTAGLFGLEIWAEEIAYADVDKLPMSSWPEPMKRKTGRSLEL